MSTIARNLGRLAASVLRGLGAFEGVRGFAEELALGPLLREARAFSEHLGHPEVRPLLGQLLVQFGHAMMLGSIPSPSPPAPTPPPPSAPNASTPEERAEDGSWAQTSADVAQTPEGELDAVFQRLNEHLHPYTRPVSHTPEFEEALRQARALLVEEGTIAERNLRAATTGRGRPPSSTRVVPFRPKPSA